MLATVGIGPLRKAGEAVRIETGIQQDDRVGKEVAHGVRVGSGKMIGHQGRGVGGTRFVAVHPVAHVDHQRHFLDGSRQLPAWLAEDLVFLPDLLEAGKVFGRGDGQDDQWSLLVGAPDFLELYAIALLREGAQVGDQLVVSQVPVADVLSQHRRGHGHVLPVVLARNRQEVGKGSRRRRLQGDSKGKHSESCKGEASDRKILTDPGCRDSQNVPVKKTRRSAFPS